MQKQNNWLKTDSLFLVAQEKPAMGIMNLKRWTQIKTGSK